jgi:hypothetical protein
MSLNLIALGLMVVFVGYHAVQAYLSPKDPDKPILPWVPIDVRRTKHYVSQTRDAGMYIERQRRVAIIGNKPLYPSYKGSTNGSLEYYLTGICVCPIAPVPVCPPDPEKVIWSDGDADDAICDNVDAGGAFGMYDAIDFGGAAGNVCDE